MRTRYLLDTNVLVHLANRAEGWQFIVARLEQVGQANTCICAPTVWEIYRMIERKRVRRTLIAAVQGLMEQFEVLPMDSHVAGLGGSLYAHLENLGRKIGERDSMIAATAMAHYLVMVTDNAREFERVPGIVMQNWRAGPTPS